MARVAALILAALLTAISAVHVYWAVGGRWGVNVAIPTSASGHRPLFQPGPIGTAAVGALLLLGAAVTMGQLLPASQVVLLRCMAVLFTLRAVGDFRYVGFSKRVRETPFAYWDTRLFSPLCVVLAMLAAIGSGVLGAP